MDRRRRSLVALLAAAATHPGHALAAERVRTLGYLSAESDGRDIVRALAAHGHVVGRNLRFEVRYAPAGASDSDRKAADLVTLGADALLSFGLDRTRALRRATTRIPIVTGRISDPVRHGFARSLARPGFNVTGLHWESSATAGMLCSLLRQLAPELSHLLGLFPPGPGVLSSDEAAFTAGAREAGVSFEIRRMDTVGQGEQLIAALNPVKSAVVLAPMLAGSNLDRLIRHATAVRVLTASFHRLIPELGGLMSFDQTYSDSMARLAALLDKVLRGADPAEIPFELPDRTEFVVNSRTATALGIGLPPDMLMRATKVIG